VTRKQDDSVYEYSVFQTGTLSPILRFVSLIKYSPNRCSACHCEDPGMISGQFVWNCAKCGNEVDFPVNTSVFPCKFHKTSTSISIHLPLSKLHKEHVLVNFFPRGLTAPGGPQPPHYVAFAITLRHIALDRTPPDEGSAQRTELYLTTHNTHTRQTSKHLAAIGPAVTTSNRPKTHALDRAATCISMHL
jgi:hypothetical protein